MQKRHNLFNAKYTKRLHRSFSICVFIFSALLSLILINPYDIFANTYASDMIPAAYNDLIFVDGYSDANSISSTGHGSTKSITGGRQWTGTNTSFKDSTYIQCSNVAYYYDSDGNQKYVDARVYPKAVSGYGSEWTMQMKQVDGKYYLFVYVKPGSSLQKTGIRIRLYEAGTTTRCQVGYMFNMDVCTVNFGLLVNNSGIGDYFTGSGANASGLKRIAEGKAINGGGTDGCNPAQNESGNVKSGNTFFYCQKSGYNNLAFSVKQGADLELELFNGNDGDYDHEKWYLNLFNRIKTSSIYQRLELTKITYYIYKADGTKWLEHQTSKLSYSKNSGDILAPSTILAKNPATGYILTNGWYTQKACTTAYDYTNSAALNGNSAIAIYTQITPITYTVKYGGNGATGGSTSDTTHTYDKAKALATNGYSRAYTVTYNANGGTCATANATATYTFNSWNTATNGTGSAFSNGQSVSNLTATNGAIINLYAIWNSGSVNLPTSTREGYTFNGWRVGSTSGTLITTSTYTPTADTVLYADWSINSYKLTFDKNGGNSVTEESRQVNYGSQYGTLPEANKTGYTFDGWYNEPGCINVVNATDTMGAANRTIYAKYKPNTYTVTYDGNNATSGTVSDSSHTYDELKNLNKNNYERQYTVTFDANEGTCLVPTATSTYSFKGWSTNSAASSISFSDEQEVKNLTASDDVVTLYAIWDNTVSSAKITLPLPTRYGYTFKGWRVGSTSGTNAGLDGTTYIPTSNVTLYAEWEVNKHTLTFDKLSGDSVSPESKTVAYNSPLGELATITKEGYTLEGWYYENTFVTKVETTDLMPDNNVTVYAKYTPNNYTVKYDSNGISTGEVLDSSHTYDELKNLNKNNYERKYIVTYNAKGGTATKTNEEVTYDFLGWSKNNLDTVQTYTDEESVKNLTSAPNGIVTLYGIWQSHNVSLPGATRDEYYFRGWYADSSYTTFLGEEGDSYTPISDSEIFAKWELIKKVVTYMDDDGVTELLPQDQYYINSPFGDIINDQNHIPHKEGYIFGGWYLSTDTTFQNRINPLSQVTGDLTLIPRWYSVSFDRDSDTYTGTNIYPSITLSDKLGNVLDASCYNVVDDGDKVNANPSGRNIIISGNNDNLYYGTINKIFTINKRELYATDVIILNYNDSDKTINKEYDPKNKDNKEVINNDLDVVYNTDNNIKFNYLRAEYSVSTPSNTDKKDVTLYDLTLKDTLDIHGNSVLNNYFIDNLNDDKTFSNYGMIKDTIRPYIEKIEIISTSNIYGFNQKIKFKVTVSEDLVVDLAKTYNFEMKLLKPFTSTEFGTIPLTLSTITPNEFLGEYTVTDDADGVNGQIDVIIERVGDNYTDLCLNELDISNVVDAKSSIKDIKIISQGFYIPVTVEPNELETKENIIKFTYDLNEVNLTTPYTFSDIKNGIKVEKVIPEGIIDITTNTDLVNIELDNTNKKIIVTIDETDEIAPDNRSGIIYRTIFNSDTVKDIYDKWNITCEGSIKVVRNLSDSDIIIMLNGEIVNHDGNIVNAKENDEFTIAIKDDSDGIGGIIEYLQKPITKITNACKEFTNFILSKTGWASSIPFDIKFNIIKDTPPGGGGSSSSGGTTITVGPGTDNKLGYKIGNIHFAYMEGYKDDTFRPNGKLTRAEMCAILTRIDSRYNDSIDYTDSISYKDEINNDAWYSNYLGYLTKNKITNGYPNGTYNAKGNITRAEFVKVISTSFGINSNYDKHIFSDAKNKWYEPYVNNLAYYGYVEGRTDKKFHGNDYITRAEACKIINSVLNRELRTSNTLSDNIKEKMKNKFKDVSSSKWYYYDIIEATMDY